MSAARQIHDRFYGRNRKFTRAVDELTIIRQQALDRLDRETQRRIVNINNHTADSEPRKIVQIILERLTADEIRDAQNGNLSRFGIHQQQRTQNNKNKNETMRKYNLRKR